MSYLCDNDSALEIIFFVTICPSGGFYTSETTTPGLRLVVVNSNLWYYHDDMVVNSTDPAGQFVWLDSTLKDAATHGHSVSFFASHFRPPQLTVCV